MFQEANSIELTSKATVQKIISEILLQLPPDVSLGNDMSFTKNARDMLIKCCMEWLSMLSAESMEVSEKGTA